MLQVATKIMPITERVTFMHLGELRTPMKDSTGDDESSADDEDEDDE